MQQLLYPLSICGSLLCILHKCGAKPSDCFGYCGMLRGSPRSNSVALRLVWVAAQLFEWLSEQLSQLLRQFRRRRRFLLGCRERGKLP